MPKSSPSTQDLLQLSPAKARLALHERQRRLQQQRLERDDDGNRSERAHQDAPFVVNYIKDFGLILVPDSRKCLSKLLKAALRRCGWTYQPDDNNYVNRCDHVGRQREITALRCFCNSHYLRFRIRTSPIDCFYPADVLTACGVPTGYERIDDAVETHQRGECALVIRRLLDALEATPSTSTTLYLAAGVRYRLCFVLTVVLSGYMTKESLAK